MIGKIKGRLSEVNGNVGLVETPSGLYYSLFLSPTYYSTDKINSEVELYTYLQTKEETMVLFGFETKGKHDLFILLLGVSGVGPKTAFSIVSLLDEKDLFEAVRHNSVEVFTKVPGLGKKTAMKIILELSTKLKSDFDMKKMVITEEDKTAVSALVSLGYRTQDAKSIIMKLPKDLTVEEKIREALKQNIKKE